MRSHCGFLLGVAIAVTTAVPAEAQTVSRLGPSTPAITGVVKGSAVAYDSKNSVYLVVSAYGPVNGRFVSADGVPLGAQFPIKAGSVGQYPRVAYSPDVDGGRGGFLVSWQQSDAINNVFTHLVSFTSGLIGPEQQLSFDGAFNESGAAVAYSSVSKEFMVVWDGMWRDPASNGLYWKSIVAQRVGMDGGKLGGLILVALPGAGGGFRDPSIAYNPDTNQYMVIYAGWNASFAFVNAQRMAPVSGALLPTGPSAGAAQLSVASGTYITEVAYNSTTKQFLANWYQFGTYGAVLDAAGNNLSGVLPQAFRFTAYDALGLAYNATSGTYMMVSHDALPVNQGGTLENGATELNGITGKPIGTGTLVTLTGAARGNYYPKVASHRGKAEWLMSTATDFVATTVQRLGSSSTGGGGTPPPSCTSSVSTTSIILPSSASKFHVDVTVPASCGWNASTAASWMQITWNASATGPASIEVSAIRNMGVPGRSGTVTVAGQTVNVWQAGFNASSTHDLTGDGFSDLVFQHQTGPLAMWSLQGSGVTSTGPLPSVGDPAWKVVGSGDLNGDGYADLVWEKDDGALAAWLLRPGQPPAGRLLSYPSVDPNWRVRGVADLSGDGYADIVLQHQTEGWVTLWTMYGFDVTSTALLSIPRVADLNWQIVGAGDINGDAHADLIWQNQSTGVLVAWIMNGSQATIVKTMSSYWSDLNWKVRGVGDVTGDGLADLIWQNISTGQIAGWAINGFVVQYGFTIFYNGAPAVVDPAWRIVGPG